MELNTVFDGQKSNGKNPIEIFPTEYRSKLGTPRIRWLILEINIDKLKSMVPSGAILGLVPPQPFPKIPQVSQQFY